jgi:hypothetical protein
MVRFRALPWKVAGWQPALLVAWREHLARIALDTSAFAASIKGRACAVFAPRFRLETLEMESASRNPERGAGKLAGLMFFVFLGAVGYIAYKVLPVYVNNYEFQDALESEARFAVSNRKTPDDIRNDIWRKVVELNIPVDKKDIQIKYPASQGGGPAALVDIDVPYNIEVEFPGYTLELSFRPHGDNHSI